MHCALASWHTLHTVHVLCVREPTTGKADTRCTTTALLLCHVVSIEMVVGLSRLTHNVRLWFGLCGVLPVDHLLQLVLVPLVNGVCVSVCGVEWVQACMWDYLGSHLG